MKHDEDFQLENENFLRSWEDKILRYKQECTNLEQELLQKQENNFAEYEASLEERIPLAPKDSARVIEIKDMIEQLAKNQEYKDAHYLQQKLFKMQEEDEGKYAIEREEKIRNLLKEMAKEHQNQHNNLRKKIISGLEELELKREKEYEMLLLKFNNKKKTIENMQTMETQFMNKTMKTNSMKKLNLGDLNRSTISVLKRMNHQGNFVFYY